MKLPFVLFGRLLALALTLPAAAALAADDILTPPTSPSPRINGATVFGVRPNSPFLYTIAATGERPMTFAADDLPAGLSLDATTGLITGRLTAAGEHRVGLHATNRLGSAARTLRIRVGEQIALTPPMGWNSWNCWAKAVDQDKVLRSARALVSSGLANHGWTYINIDDSWQGSRSGPLHAIQANEKFPDMKALCEQIHAMGLKAGIYSTPWITSYAHFVGGSSDAADGAWDASLVGPARGARHGAVSFAAADAQQWGQWGFDYLKYDWFPIDVPHVKEMSLALRASGRDVVYSLSNAAPFDQAADLAHWANSWRTTGDIWDQWSVSDKYWRFGVSEIGFSQDRWASTAGPGHWNDPDMLVVGLVGWGPQLHPSHLTADEQYSHISLWCLFSAPLLIGCDLERLDAFTLGLLSNDEVLAVDQDALGRQAVRVATIGGIDVFAKPLENGTVAVGFFNRGAAAETVGFDKFQAIGLNTQLHVRARDLWRQMDLPDIAGMLQVSVAGHGVKLYTFANVAGSAPVGEN